MKNRELKKKLGEECVYCGCRNKLLLNIDHIIPKSSRKKYLKKNKQVTCFFCNYLKGDLSNKEFKILLKNLYSLYDLGKINVWVERFIIKFNPQGFPIKSTKAKVNHPTKKNEKS